VFPVDRGGPGVYGVVTRFDVPHPTAETDDLGNLALPADRSFFAQFNGATQTWRPLRSFLLRRLGTAEDEEESWVDILGTDGKTTVYALPEDEPEIDLGKIVVMK
jgi:hypothetical protein